MPIYDYVCQDCGHREEVVHGVHAHGPSVCPVCGGRMRKAIAAPAVHFKGSGWAKKERSSSAAGASKSKPAKTTTGSEEPSKAASAGDPATTGSSAPDGHGGGE